MDLNTEVRNMKAEYQRRGGYRFDFQYTDPEPNFDRRRVKGMLGTLLRVRDNKNMLALSTAAGGSLYSMVTDTPETGKLVIQRGNLQSRVTIIPLSKVSSRSLDPQRVRAAEQLVGAANVAPALSLIEYAPELDPAMKFAFGGTFVCKDINIAKKVAYNPNVMCRCVTLDGDVVSPDGTLSGGSAPKGGAVLLEIAQINQLRDRMAEAENELRQIGQQLVRVEGVANRFGQLKEQMNLMQYELEAANKRLGNTTFRMHQQEIDDLKQEIGK